MAGLIKDSHEQQEDYLSNNHSDGVMKLFKDFVAKRNKEISRDKDLHYDEDAHMDEAAKIDDFVGAVVNDSKAIFDHTSENETETEKSISHFNGFRIELSPQNELTFTKEANYGDILAENCNVETDSNSYTNGENKDIEKLTRELKQDGDEVELDVDEAYMTDRRGYMVAVVNDQFIGDDSQREGGSVDLRKMEEIGNKFGFNMINHDMNTNLSSFELRDILSQIQRLDHSERDCFVFMISTHGESLPGRTNRSGGDYGLSCSDGEVISICEIITALNDVNCPTLKDKPKILFIQACRGPKMDEGCPVHVIKASRPCNDLPDGKKRECTTIDFETPYLQCANDMLIMFAAPPGMYAWRNDGDGSWMIHELHKALMNYHFIKPTDFLRVLTKVSAAMARRMTCCKEPELNGKVIVPVILNKLTKDIQFKIA